MSYGREYVSIIGIGKNESEYDRKLRMVSQLSQLCISCSLCECGLKKADKNDEFRDPHLLGNNNPRDYMIVLNKPSWDDLRLRKPLSGIEWSGFKNGLINSGLDESDFYVTYLTKCYESTDDNFGNCGFYLGFEIASINPKLIIVFDDIVADSICDERRDGDNTISKSKYGINMFKTNINSTSILCKLISAIDSR